MARGLNIYRTGNGLGKISTADRSWSALCMGGIAVTGGAQLNTVYELNSPNDAVALGINAAYDVANTTLVYYHIKEFFRLSPSGKLFIMLVSQSVTLTAMADVTTTNGLYKLLNDPKCAGKVRFAAICLNPASGYTPTITAGINADVIAVAIGVYSGAAVKAQALAAQCFAMHRPVYVFIEARDFSGIAANLLDATTGAGAGNRVEAVIAADNDISNGNALYHGHAAVGTFLGARSGIQIQQQISYPAVVNLQNAATGDWVNPGLSSNTLLSAFSEGYWSNNIYTNGDQDVIESKGFVAPIVFADTPGVFIACDITMSPTTDDYNLGPNGIVVNEASRIIYKYMVPNLNADVDIDKNTGALDPVLVATWQAECARSLNDNLNGNVSAVSCLIDPNQNLLATSVITIQLLITPKGYANQINIPIGLTNPFKTA